MNITKLEKIAYYLRQDTIIEFIKSKEAHLGGSFSIIEIIVIMFEKILKKNDKFILSKSHASYPFSLMLKKKGYKPKIKTHLEKDPKNKIFCTTGSLGHGLPIATGMAFAKKISNKKGNIFVLISDGECQEGTTWESILIANKLKLNNLIILIDYNKIQALTSLNEGLPLGDLKSKFTSFGCLTKEIANGHCFQNLNKNLNIKNNTNKPMALIINTIKGKGIKEFENDPKWHAKKIKEDDMIIINKYFPNI